MSNSIDRGSVIRQTFNMYLDHALVLLPAAAVVFGPIGILSAILIAASADLVYVSFLISAVATTLFTGMVVKLVDDVQNGRCDTSVGQVLLAVMPGLGELILVGVIAGIGVYIGFILIVVPGLILATVWSVAAPVVVLERPGGLCALGRSRELVRGNGWQVFGVVFVMVFLVGLLASGVDLAANSVGTVLGLAIRVIMGIFTAPLAALAAAVLYFELRGASSTAGVDDILGSATSPSDAP
jgi:hypothetical protein